MNFTTWWTFVKFLSTASFLFAYFSCLLICPTCFSTVPWSHFASKFIMASLQAEDVSSMNIVQLRTQLAYCGLETSGRKALLIQC